MPEPASSSAGAGDVEVAPGVPVTETRNNVLRFPWTPAALRRDPGAGGAASSVEKPCAFSAAAATEAVDHLSYDAELAFPEIAATYWNDPRIHGFGNVGAWGAFHAVVAPTFTFALDVFAYGGVDVRKAAWERIAAQRGARGAPPIARAVDLGTGTGPTARSLARFFGGVRVDAVDTSPEMLKAARDLASTAPGFFDGVTLLQANAENTGLDRGAADLAAVFFLLHEAPAVARKKIVTEAHALLAPGGTLAVCDIHPAYKPTPLMAQGEPYVAGYLDNVDAEMHALLADTDLEAKDRHEIYEGRLVLWTFHRPLNP